MKFGAESTATEAIAGIDLHGRVAVITGASGGIGLETARALASAGATVVLGNRSIEKSEAAVADLKAGIPDAQVEFLVLDLTSLASVRQFAEQFLARHDRLDLLVNNAGVMATPFERTADGFELQFGTNHLSHFLLTNLLMPAILAAAPARIVNLTSNAHFMSDMDWDDPNYDKREYASWPAYGQSKTANILFTTELERRYGPRGVHVYAVHPGLVGTDLMRYLSDEDRTWLDTSIQKNGATYKTPQQGAATSVWAATAPELEGQGGLYLEDCTVSERRSPYAVDAAAARRLWTLSEQMVGQQFPE